MIRPTSTRHFALGLLVREPMSGYDIKRLLMSLDWLVEVPSFGSLYSALHTLLADEMVTVEVVPGGSGPSRKIYGITETGRQTLGEWLRQPVAPDGALKAFVMRLILADHLPGDGLRAHLERRRAQIAAQRTGLEQATAAMDENTNLGERLTFGYGLALATAELCWLDCALDRFAQPQPDEAEVHRAMI